MHELVELQQGVSQPLGWRDASQLRGLFPEPAQLDLQLFAGLFALGAKLLTKAAAEGVVEPCRRGEVVDHGTEDIGNSLLQLAVTCIHRPLRAQLGIALGERGLQVRNGLRHSLVELRHHRLRKLLAKTMQLLRQQRLRLGAVLGDVAIDNVEIAGHPRQQELFGLRRLPHVFRMFGKQSEHSLTQLPLRLKQLPRRGKRRQVDNTLARGIAQQIPTRAFVFEDKGDPARQGQGLCLIGG